MEDIYNKLIEVANKSLENGDVPVGALIVKDGKIISEGYNTREKDQSILGHAEINAIINASKTLNLWNLNGYDLYVTLKPCSMCLEIIKQARISNVYYLLDKPVEKLEFSKTNILKIFSYQRENLYKEKLTAFFHELREKNK